MRIEEGKAVKQWPCKHNGCRKPITKGQRYYLWHSLGDALRQHHDHGTPAVKNNTKQAAAKTKVTKKKAAKKTTKKAAKKVSRKGKGSKK